MLAVVGYRSDLVRQELAGEAGVEFVEQTEQLGTGHAVMMCREQLANHAGPVLILAGDSPLVQSSSLRALLAEFAAQQTACLHRHRAQIEPGRVGPRRSRFGRPIPGDRRGKRCHPRTAGDY